MVAWEPRTRETIKEKDVVLNYALLKPILMEIGHIQPTLPLLDYKAAFIVATTQHNFHSALYKVKGGRGIIRDT